MPSDDLTPKQRAFVTEYVKDRNGTQALIRAGYSEKGAHVSASQLLRNPKVKAAIDALTEADTDKAKAQREWIINRLMQIAGVDMSDLATWNESGMTWKDSSQLSPAAKASVQQIEQVMNEHGGTLKIKQYDRMSALKLLGQHFGMFKEQVEVNATVTARPAQDLSDEELARAVEADE